MTDLFTELRATLETRRVAEQRISELRQLILRGDLPRPWSFSHEGAADWARDQPGARDFLTVEATRVQVEAKLEEAIRALPFDRSAKPLDIRATGYCKDTGESVEIWVQLSQTEPACERPEGHEWAALIDDSSPEDFRDGRKLTQGCPHCDGRKETLWPHKSKPHCVVSYEVPGYSEGWVARELRSGQRPYTW